MSEIFPQKQNITKWLRSRFCPNVVYFVSLADVSAAVAGCIFSTFDKPIPRCSWHICRDWLVPVSLSPTIPSYYGYMSYTVEISYLNIKQIILGVLRTSVTKSNSILCTGDKNGTQVSGYVMKSHSGVVHSLSSLPSFTFGGGKCFMASPSLTLPHLHHGVHQLWRVFSFQYLGLKSGDQKDRNWVWGKTLKFFPFFSIAFHIIFFELQIDLKYNEEVGFFSPWWQHFMMEQVLLSFKWDSFVKSFIKEFSMEEK